MNAVVHGPVALVKGAMTRRLAACLLFLVCGAEAAAQSNCVVMTADEGAVNKALGKFENVDLKAVSHLVQAGLKTVFENDPGFEEALRSGRLTDDNVGSDTRAWLQNFCEQYGVDRGPPPTVDNVIGCVVDYARLAEAHPDWKATITDARFARWAATRDSAERYALAGIRRTCAASHIQKLLDDYPPPPPKPCPPAAEVGSGVHYRLSASDIEALKARKDVSSGVSSVVRELAGRQFGSETALRAAARPASGDEAPKCVVELAETIEAVVEPPLRPAQIEKALEVLAKDLLTEVSDALMELQDQGFESEEALRKALREQVEPTISERSKSVVDEVVRGGTVNELLIGADSVAAPRDQPQVVTRSSEEELSKLDALRGVAYVNARLYRSAVVKRFGEGELSDPKIIEAVVRQARKDEPVSLPPLQAPDGCGCAGDFAGTTVYGFYPYWDAGADAGDGATSENVSIEVNFSLLQRIGYPALHLNEFGMATDLEKRDGTQKKRNAKRKVREFITKAHRYRTEVDLVVQAHGWWRWDNDALADAVEAVLTHLGSAETTLSERILQRLVHGFRNGFLSPRPDGVTLHFPDYHAFADGGRLIAQFVRELRRGLRARGHDPEFAVNLALDLGLDLNRTGAGECAAVPTARLDTLRPLLVGPRESLRNGVDHLLVFLQQPTSDAKKALRQALEDAFHGEQRVQALRRIMPVIPPNGYRDDASQQQLSDDLYYFKDNFGGVAWWPVSDGDGYDSDVREERMREIFTETMELSFLTRLPGLCDLVCPNRVVVIGALVLAIPLVGLPLVLFGCALRRRAAANPRLALIALLALLMPFLVLLLALFVCDPVLNPYSTELAIFLLLGLAALVLLRYFGRLQRGPIP